MNFAYLANSSRTLLTCLAEVDRSWQNGGFLLSFEQALMENYR
jgi:hypothetical protein